MAAEDCIRIIRDSFEDLSDEEIEEIVEELQRRVRARQARGDLGDLDDALLNAADELVQDVTEAAQIERRNALINIAVRDTLLGLTDAAERSIGDPSLGLEAAMVGVNAPFPGARRSVDARASAIFRGDVGGMIADLRRENLLPEFNSRAMEQDIARELEQLTLEGGRPGVTDNSDARKIAEIIDKYRRASLQRQNRAGAWIKPLPGYITRQTHDMARMRRAGFEAWRDFILPKLDHAKTFDGADPEEFLRAAYDGLVTGNHLKAEGQADSDLKFAFKGPANLAKRISQNRVLHFKDADAWFGYNQRFGRRSLTEAIIQDLELAARNTALMETFGTNPRAMFDTVRQELEAKHRSDTDKFDRLRRRTLDYQFAEIDGSANIPAAPTAARVAAAVRTLESLSSLGGAFISSIADIAAGASELRFQGKNLLGRWGGMLDNVTQGLSTDREKRQFGDLIGVGLDGMLGDIASRWSAQDDVVGAFSKTQQFFFKINLLGPWTDGNKRGLGMMMARDLAMESDRAWADMTPRKREMLELYGFDARKWDIARKAVREAEDGRTYLMPDEIRNLPDDAFGGLSDRQIRRLKDDIETSLRSYYVDRAEFASPTPGAREKAIMRRGTQPGTVEGEALRFVMQFKSFPITVLTRVVGRDVFGRGAPTLRDAFLKGQGDMRGLAEFMVASTVLGYLAQTGKEIAKGRTARDPDDPETWVAAMLQGGGAGIYGDFLFGEYNRFGRSLLDTLAGPALGDVADLAELFARVRAGEDAAASSVRFITGNLPFANLFYTRLALDYLILFQIQEAMNPGALRRRERTIERENAQRYILPPSQVIPRGGGSRLFEGVR